MMNELDHENLVCNLYRNSQEGESQALLIGSKLPSFANGIILYNGPVGIWDLQKSSAKSWFDGLSILQSFRIDADSGVVYYTKKFLKSEAHQKATNHGKLIFAEYDSAGCVDPDKNMPARMIDSIIPGEMTDNCASSFYKIGGLLVASTETALLRIIDPLTLETGDKIDLTSLVNISGARAQMDSNGDWFNLTGTFKFGISYHFIKFPKSEDRNPESILSNGKILCTIPSRLKSYFSYYHSFGMTNRFLIMIEQPWVVNVVRLIASRIRNLSFKDCLEWCPSEINRFHIVDKQTGNIFKTVYISNKPFFFLNIINAFEDVNNNLIVIDIIGYDSPEILNKTTLEILRKGSFNLDHKSKVLRFTLPIVEDYQSKDWKLESQNIQEYGNASFKGEQSRFVLTPNLPVFEEGGFEHPVINPRFRGKSYKYCYVIGWVNSVNGGVFANAITKINLETGNLLQWKGSSFENPSEVSYIPNELDPQEDSGIISATITDVRKSEKDYLLFLNAKTMKEISRATFDIDIPFSSHSLFLPKS